MSRLLIASLCSILIPSVVYGESSVATTDLEVELQSDSLSPNTGDTIHIDLTVKNRGQFAASGVVSLPVPEGLTLIETVPSTDYVEASGEWQTDEIVSFSETSIRFTFSVNPVAPANVILVADLKSLVGSFGAFDIDSTPGNNDPSEDDHAELILQINCEDFSDSGVSNIDCHPLTPVDAGARIDARTIPTDNDAGLTDESGPDGGCSTGSGASSHGLMLLLLIALLRQKRSIHRTPEHDNAELAEG